MNYRMRTLGAALTLVFALTLAMPAQVDAQTADRPLSVDARGGIAIPEGGLKNLVDVGPSVGLGLAYRVHPRVSIRADGQLDLYGGADFDSQTATQSAAPDVNLWHVSGAVEYAVLRAGEGSWNVAVHGGGGITTIDSDSYVDGTVTNPRTQEEEISFLESYFTVNSGLRAGYAVNPMTTVYAGVRWYWVLTDAEDTAGLATLDPGELWAFDEAHSLPMTLGVQLSF